MEDNSTHARATSEPEVTMSAVKITRDGKRIPIEMHDVEVSPGFIEQIKQAAAKGWQEGRTASTKRGGDDEWSDENLRMWEEEDKLDPELEAWVRATLGE